MEGGKEGKERKSGERMNVKWAKNIEGMKKQKTKKGKGEKSKNHGCQSSEVRNWLSLHTQTSFSGPGFSPRVLRPLFQVT